VQGTMPKAGHSQGFIWVNCSAHQRRLSAKDRRDIGRPGRRRSQGIQDIANRLIASLLFDTPGALCYNSPVINLV
jgi:hypothetical protein